MLFKMTQLHLQRDLSPRSAMNEVDPPQRYRHPGEAFLSHYGALQREEDVYCYVEFLRHESGLSDTPPIDLGCIYRCFGIPTPLRAPLDEQQGILVDSSTGIILIKETDPVVRQRFTEGHELMELLFDAQSQSRIGSALPQWSEQRKERLCDRGAADLLMPQSSFVPHLTALGVSLSAGRSLAALYQTSLIATLVRMIQHCSGDSALIMWRCAFKPTEVKQKRHSISTPQKKLRVWWRTQSPQWTGGFIPKDKSIAHDSLISHTYVSGQPHSGLETIHLGWGSVYCQVEAMPIQMGETTCVLSLLQRFNE